MDVIVKEMWSDGSLRITSDHDVSIKEYNDCVVFFIPNDCGGGYEVTVFTKKHTL